MSRSKQTTDASDLQTSTDKVRWKEKIKLEGIYDKYLLIILIVLA